MSDIKKIYISKGSINLEAEFFQPQENNALAVLLTHPHPKMGGNMYNNVVSGIFHALKEKEICCLRFNFLGVGKSKNKSSKKITPISQVELAIDYLLENEDIDRFLICGYSYGAAVGCSTVNYSKKIVGYIAIAFPWDYMSEKYKKLSQSDKPKLFIQGDNDSIAYFSKFKFHYEFYIEPKTYEIIEGADHFYRGYEDQLAELVFTFYKRQK